MVYLLLMLRCWQSRNCWLLQLQLFSPRRCTLISSCRVHPQLMLLLLLQLLLHLAGPASLARLIGETFWRKCDTFFPGFSSFFCCCFCAVLITAASTFQRVVVVNLSRLSLLFYIFYANVASCMLIKCALTAFSFASFFFFILYLCCFLRCKG